MKKNDPCERQSLFEQVLLLPSSSYDGLDRLIGPLNRVIKAGPSDSCSLEQNSLHRTRHSPDISRVDIQFSAIDYHHEDPFTTFPDRMDSFEIEFLNLTLERAEVLFEKWGRPDKFYLLPNAESGVCLKWSHELPEFKKKKLSDERLAEVLCKVRRCLEAGFQQKEIEREFAALFQGRGALLMKDDGWNLELQLGKYHRVVNGLLKFDHPVAAQGLVRVFELKSPVAQSEGIYMDSFYLYEMDGQNAERPKIRSFDLVVRLSNYGPPQSDGSLVLRAPLLTGTTFQTVSFESKRE